MAAGLERVIHLVHSIAKLPNGSQSSDFELLDRYVDGNDQLAFAALVHRHGCLVFNVCKRVLTNHQDAEDAFQATFLILASKAKKVREHSVGSWLHTVAYRTALAARSRRQQRNRIETIVDILPEREVPPSEQEWWRFELDLAVRQLPVKYREPIVLCELGSASRKAAAKQLGVPEGTLSSRLNRARAMLARRLRQRGFEPLAVILGRAGVASIGGIVSKSLIDQTCQLAGLLASDGNAIATSSVGTLIKGVQKTMWIAKWRAAASVMGVFALLAIGGLSSFSTALTAAPEQSAVQPTPAAQGVAVAPDETSKILQEIIRGHRANREAMRTLHVVFQSITDWPYSYDPKKHQDRLIEWWQEENRVRETQRWVERVGWNSGVYAEEGTGRIRSKNKEDTFAVPEKSQRLSISDIPGQGKSLHASISQGFGERDHVDLWGVMGFATNLSQAGADIPGILASREWAKSICRKSVGSRVCFEVLCQRNDFTIKLQIDPAKGYLATQIEYWRGANRDECSALTRLEIDQFRECVPGVYFPTHSLLTLCNMLRKNPDEFTIVRETWIDFIKINQPVPTNRFVNPIPEGTLTVDWLKGWRYIMGPDGKPSPSEPVYSQSGAVIRKAK